MSIIKKLIRFPRSVLEMAPLPLLWMLPACRLFRKNMPRGIPLGTQSEWGWHSFIDTMGYEFKETLKSYDIHGRLIPYPVQFKTPGRKQDAANWFRENPHRLHLGVVGLDLTKSDGARAQLKDIEHVDQQLDLWKGAINSDFSFDNVPVKVTTYCHQEMDLIAAKVASPLLSQGQLKIKFRFPYPSGDFVGDGCDWNSPQKHTTTIISSDKNNVVFQRKLDSVVFYVTLSWKGNATVEQKGPHEFLLSSPQSILEFSCLFSQNRVKTPLPDFEETASNSETKWQKFWDRGGAIDFSGSTDPRAFELERRIVLSQYLMAIQCAGSLPPQETGLTYNSWYGKFHLEMHWWHAAHFALWNRIDLLEKSLDWYK